MRRLLLALVILLGAQTLALAQSPLAPSLWKNQRGSTLEIQWAHPSWDGVTHFGGTFVNHANGFECKGIPYPAYGGEPRGAHATFTVAFQPNMGPVDVRITGPAGAKDFLREILRR